MRLMAREGIDTTGLADAIADLTARAQTPVFAAIDGKLAAVMAIADPVKPTSRAVVDALHARGLKVAMITGDTRATAQAIAAATGH